jgi:hypothetical protein
LMTEDQDGDLICEHCYLKLTKTYSDGNLQEAGRSARRY